METWKEKTVVVTGGSSGLGLAIGKEFASAGAQVAMIGRDPARLDRAVAQFRDDGPQPLAIAADITRQEDVDAAATTVREQFGRLDVLVNCAGKSTRGAALDTTPEAFQQLWEINFLGAVRCTRALAPLLIESRGHIVNIGSLASKSASRFLGAYPASKHALAAYSQQLRLELGEQGVHVMLVCPGPIARKDAGYRYEETAPDVPAEAKKPGGGVHFTAIPPKELARRIRTGCEKRRPEIVVPRKARILFALSQIWPATGDWIIRKKTGG